ncbi:MAG: hypothetical protein H6656_02175 [Ardenticatenaceae bacterium]|nr:hypothetical protein [Ardenticatenaceae bacterium]
MSKPTTKATLLNQMHYLLLLVLVFTGCNSVRTDEVAVQSTAVQQTIEARDAAATQQAALATAAVTPTFIPTATATATPTSTATSVPPTATATAPPPTATATRIPPTPVPPRPTLSALLPPNFGSTSLLAGFLPDPTIISLTSGGGVDVSYLNGFGCTGYATAAPDFRLIWSGNGGELSFMFNANSVGDDTTLIINDPNGNWYCNDDFAGVNPGIRFNTAVSGQYDIWIGSYSANDNISGQLNISELSNPPNAGLDPSLEPNFGSTSLAFGFFPDPKEISLTSGGDVDVSYLNNGFGCTGYATAAPDFRLFWSGSGDALNFMFIPDFSGDDTTLIINDPVGNWYCNDDFAGVNPGIHLDTAVSGQYDIWIGSFSANDNISGILNITEFAIP